MNFSNPKILFVISDDYKCERLGIQILSAIALEEGYERESLILSSLPPPEALNKVRAFSPQIIAYSAMTFEHIELQQFNRWLKHSGLKFISIFGGPHYTFNPEEIYADDDIDVLCRGEAELVFRDFIKALRDGRRYQRIEKLWSREGGKVIENPVGFLIDDLDSIPFPDRNLFPLMPNIEGTRIYGRSMSVMFGRGCPHRCTYCFNAGWNDLFRGSRIIRHRSMDNVLEELKLLIKEYSPDSFYFWDDDFGFIPREVIKEFCLRYKKEINRPFAVNFSARTVDEVLIALLKDAGLAVATVGVECGDEQIAQGLLGRENIGNQKIIDVFRIFNKYGIKNYSQNLSVLPVEDPLELDFKTINLNIQCQPTVAHFFILVPYPKTAIWKYAVRKRYLKAGAFRNLSKLPSCYTTSLLKYKDRSRANQAINLHKFAGIVVKFPFLIPLVKLLIKLPPNRMFQYIFLAWYGYGNAVILWQSKITLKLLVNGLRSIRQYLRKH